MDDVAVRGYGAKAADGLGKLHGDDVRRLAGHHAAIVLFGDELHGAGAESRRPLGLAVCGGLIVSQALTLYITPVYYAYIEGARQWLARRKSVPVAEAALAGGAAETSHVAVALQDAERM